MQSFVIWISYALIAQVRHTIDPSSVGSTFYGHPQQQQQQHAGNLLHHRHHHHHHHHHQYHQQHPSTVLDTVPAGCRGDRGDAIPQFDAAAAGRDAVVLGTSLHRSQQRPPGNSFAGASRGVPELSDRACVDRYDFMLLGCDQFAKISFTKLVINLYLYESLTLWCSSFVTSSQHGEVLFLVSRVTL